MNALEVTPVALASSAREAAAYYEAYKMTDGRFLVLEQPAMVWDSFHATLEAAQAYALAMNEWLAARPDPQTVEPFFNPEIPDDSSARATYARLQEVLDAMLRPEDYATRLMERA